MPEIGATLREARMRARIDISEIEAETKIRAKYLRALENEEWGLLPGPAYVRSFLRTYAEALDLDAKLLLEEYKLRHEVPSDHDLMPIGAPRRGRGRGRGVPSGRQRPSRGVPRWAVAIVLVLALCGALYALGTLGGGNDDDGGGAAAQTDTTSTTTVPRRATGAASSKGSSTPAKTKASTTASSRLVRLQIVPTGPGPVYVCLEGAGGELRLPGVSLQPGSSSGVYRSSKFRLRLGNGNARLRVDGRVRDVADVSPVAYVITRKAVTRIDPANAPTCLR